MARMTHIVDDIDGSPADGTVTFSFDGKSYEIDLSADNAEKMREEFARWARAGRRVVLKDAGQEKARPVRQRSQDPDVTRIREWAKEQGHRIGDRGRIPTGVRMMYDAAHNGS